WMAGVEIDWGKYYEGEKRKRVALPTYPFERQRYWIEAETGVEKKSRSKTSDESGGIEPAPGKAMADVSSRSQFMYSSPLLPNPYIAPASDREKLIAAIWQMALGVDRVGVNDNFFELGGDSLIAISVISRLKEEFKIDIPVASLYERITI